MQIDVRCFASAREATGVSALAVNLPEGASITDLTDALLERFPSLAAELPSLRFALGIEFCTPDQVLHDGATVALIPPVGGG